MKRYLRIAAVMAVLALVAAACGGGDESPSGQTTTSPGQEIAQGGTLTTVMTQDFFYGLDPTQEYYSVSWEFLQCCMARTMYTYESVPADEGGGVPVPDIADGEPTVSEDGLTWTFAIKDGVMFGDPLNRQVVAQDFVNAINRLADPDINGPGYPFYYTRIAGFQDAWDGKADEVSGVKAVDDSTFEVTLNEPEPDMPFLFAMAATAPIPTELIEAHYDAVELGQFLVSSGPYQWEGMEGIDLTSKTPPSGMDIGRSYVFVRNPSYDPATDGRRPAYPDQIEIQLIGDVQDGLDKVDAGAVDWCIDCNVTATTLQAYSADPALAERLKTHPADALSYTGFNVFQPPMDDVHVRKALNWAMDKAAYMRLLGGPVAGVVAGHFVPPGMMGGLNADYDPYATPDNRGDIDKAKEEMAQSKYDTNQDGVCDGDVCTVQAFAVTNDQDAIKTLEIMNEGFSQVGINLQIQTQNYNTLVAKCAELAAHRALCQAGWGKDYPSPYTFFGPLLDGGENGSNYSFMGATEEDLTKAGYEIPDNFADLAITDDIAACQATPVGDEQNQCWADLDVKVMEEIVPVLPRRFPNDNDVLGENIINYSYNQFTGVGAVDKMALASAGA
jgi:peptide/nickel transport system substrate-binding protein